MSAGSSVGPGGVSAVSSGSASPGLAPRTASCPPHLGRPFRASGGSGPGGSRRDRSPRPARSSSTTSPAGSSPSLPTSSTSAPAVAAAAPTPTAGSCRLLLRPSEPEVRTTDDDDHVRQPTARPAEFNKPAAGCGRLIGCGGLSAVRPGSALPRWQDSAVAGTAGASLTGQKRCIGSMATNAPTATPKAIPMIGGVPVIESEEVEPQPTAMNQSVADAICLTMRPASLHHTGRTSATCTKRGLKLVPLVGPAFGPDAHRRTYITREGPFDRLEATVPMCTVARVWQLPVQGSTSTIGARRGKRMGYSVVSRRRSRPERRRYPVRHVRHRPGDFIETH